MLQKQFTKPGKVLNSKGVPNAGFSTSSMLEYDRRSIRVFPTRIKEWDFYQVSDQEKCVQFTFGHASYAGQIGIMLFDFLNKKMICTDDTLLMLPMGSLHMPENTETDHVLTYDKRGVFMQFSVAGDTRVLTYRHGEITANLRLVRENPNSVVINIPFSGHPHHFYYNQKINCMRAIGTVTSGGHTWLFDESNSYGLLDWGRGAWPYHNEWFWSNGTGIVSGKLFGFNLGCGFGDLRAATENMLFWDGGASKLGAVKITHEPNYMKPWHLTDEDGRLNLVMTPMYDRTTSTKAVIINNCCHQVFGSFSGTAVLDDGTKLQIRDVRAFAEHAVNNW